MVYDREPDWLSLQEALLYTASGEQFTLVHVVEGLAKWKEDIVDPNLLQVKQCTTFRVQEPFSPPPWAGQRQPSLAASSATQRSTC